MTADQSLLVAILLVLLGLLAWGRWRYDVVAFLALMTAVVAGLVPSREAFAGFGHPATITVAAVLVLSRALTNSGATDRLAQTMGSISGAVGKQIMALSGVAALLSGFMNNIGTLGLMMPVATQAARKAKRSAALLLMPLSFGAILGGLLTLIGTPPNIIIATYRGELTGEPFGFFDFTPVGAPTAIVGLLFVALIGWRLLPRAARERAVTAEIFDIENYVAEARVTEESDAADKTLREIDEETKEIDARIIGLVRDERLQRPYPRWQRLRRGDRLVIEATSEEIDRLVSALGLELGYDSGPPDDDSEVEDLPDKEKKDEGENEASEDKASGDEESGDEVSDDEVSDDEVSDDEAEAKAEDRKSEDEAKKKKDKDKDEKEAVPVARRLRDADSTVVEAVVAPRSRLEGRTPDSPLLARHGFTLLAAARQGRPYRGRLRNFRFRVGDVLLLHGESERLGEALAAFGCLPLAERSLSLGRRGTARGLIAIFAAAIAASSLGLLPFQIALPLAVVVSVLAGLLPVRELYDGIDWPVIVLLGSLIPVGGALQTTGLSDAIADSIHGLTAGGGSAVLVMVLLMAVTMTLSDLLNNAATAVIMAPIGAGIAGRLEVSADPFLMAVAISASCAFLTPIGHQNNALIMGPGGYRFWDYWRMGLPLEILIIAVSVPMILLVWPL
ncbi:MAG TPA: SLC13 family permease [Kiloniellales bacterium]|nr:SLC13 family permease [Kiloniellales bacterium]